MSAESGAIYEPLDFVVVRAPLLPVDTLDALGDGETELPLSDEIRAALAVASPSYSDALQDDGSTIGPIAPDLAETLRRYLKRMSTRPTPLGLFAGVGLGTWGEHTDLELAVGPRPRRTRPDASWLMAIVERAEAEPEIRRHLRVVANRTAFVRASRVVLAERVSRGETPAPPAVSVRATDVVRRALAGARTPVPFADLASRILAQTPGASPEQVEKLLGQLCEQTLLLTELRPPLTVSSPARFVLDRLAAIPAAAELRESALSILQAAAAWDAEPAPCESAFRRLTARAVSVAQFDRSPLQVDTSLPLRACTVSHLVAVEAARAAELLLRLSPIPRGPSALEAYRHMFESRYGVHRQVPLLELLDPHVGLGPHPSAAHARASAPSSRLGERNRILLDLATTALRGRTRSVELDAPTMRLLQAEDLTPVNVPLSLDLTIVIAAASRDAVTAGDFELTIGPSIGSMAAGRMLGRFADFVPGGHEALSRVAASETARTPGRIMAELAYAPRVRRLGNVSIRPNARPYEIALGVTSGADPDHTIPADELVVCVRGGRFSLVWTRTGEEVVVTAGHMLTSARAPSVCRFLSEVGRDGVCQLTAFSWGTASSLPFLPRVRSGRVVLSLAQWRLEPRMLPAVALDDLDRFRAALDEWRADWAVPVRLALASGDHRLPLDLTGADDADELRRALRRSRSSVVLTESFPEPGREWLTDCDGRRFAAELVIPLVRRVPSPAPPAARAGGHPPVDLRPPGSDWLFLKLYVARDMEDELLVGPIRELTDHVAQDGFGDWFFIRYTDTGRHIRLRFRGDPDRLLTELLPQVTRAAAAFMSSGLCQRFAIDTYEREIARFGGPEATSALEAMFVADSAVVLDLLELQRTPGQALEPLALATLTVDALLTGLGLDLRARAAWCAKRAGSRRESGADYRAWKAMLRPMLAGTAVEPASGPDGLSGMRDRLREASCILGRTLDRLQVEGNLTVAPADIYGSLLHLHVNRLLAADHAMERRVFGLLDRLYAGLSASGGLR